MQLFYTPDIILPRHTLSEEESRHCAKVLRLKRGDELHLTDGRGNLYRAKVTDPNIKGCVVDIVETFAQFEKRSYGLTMAVAPTKNIDRFEWFLEKSTEVGIDRVVPLNCRNSERKTINDERMTRIVASAVKQSLKAYFPIVDPLTDFKKFIAEPFDGTKLIAHCGAGERKYLGDLIAPNTNTLILIGPEGDFTPEEVSAALANGFAPITLGPSRLRTETAAVAAVMTVQVINELKA